MTWQTLYHIGFEGCELREGVPLGFVCFVYFFPLISPLANHQSGGDLPTFFQKNFSFNMVVVSYNLPPRFLIITKKLCLLDNSKAHQLR